MKDDANAESAGAQVKALANLEVALLAELGQMGIKRQQLEKRLADVQSRLEGARLGLRLGSEEGDLPPSLAVRDAETSTS